MKKSDETLVKLYDQYPWLYKEKYWGITLNEYMAQVNVHLMKMKNTKLMPYSPADMYNLSLLDDYKDSYTGNTTYFVSEAVAVLACIFQPTYDQIICIHPFCTENDNPAISARIFSTSFGEVLDFMKKNEKNILDDKRHVGFKV
jgi:hypothetical protein